MTKEKLREALDNFVQSYGINYPLATLAAHEVLGYAAGYGFDMPFGEGYDVAMEVIRDYEIPWRTNYDQF